MLMSVSPFQNLFTSGHKKDMSELGKIETVGYKTPPYIDQPPQIQGTIVRMGS